ncbi:nematode cuticle collagen domain protein [Teladorsagia circumcincta]|uniref:Nematode cuticle collagen domain protein n=1 Tax=Teladorsagia circumcincta TaxID=45464 RepID=A0A2G9UK15_TELCI|nr:nematode cuticle collagen domain protein [Teladorsagia circumcincta]
MPEQKNNVQDAYLIQSNPANASRARKPVMLFSTKLRNLVPFIVPHGKFENLARVLLRDISSLYYDVMDEMHEFKIIANEAWKDMITATQPSTLSREEFSTIFGRAKRSKAVCACAATKTQDNGICKFVLKTYTLLKAGKHDRS